jgi:hypothetical protein
MWVKDDLLPAQEHFLSNLIRQKLFAAIDSLPLPTSSDQKWVLFLNEEEDHEIGLLFASYLIQPAYGKEVIYLGSQGSLSGSGDGGHAEPAHSYLYLFCQEINMRIR